MAALTALTVKVAAVVISMSVAYAATILDTLDFPPSTIVALTRFKCPLASPA